MTDLLAQPLSLPCGAELRNRIFKSAMTEGLADEYDRATEAHCTLYRKWAEGGSGMLLTGNVMIDRRFLERPGNVVIDGNGGHDALRRWAEAGTVGGTHLWMQISHPGRQCARVSSNRPLAPSAVQLRLLGNFARPRAMTEGEVEDALDRYARVAVVARETGFTGVQVHGAHGYLISQFLSPITNRRDDQWGGSLENRARFLLEAVRRVRRAVGADYPVSVKLNSADFQKGGFTLDESLQVAQWLQDEGIDLLEISGGTYEQARMIGATGRDDARDEPVRDSTRQREAYFVDYAVQMRRSLHIPLAVTGGFRTRESIVQALADDALDAVGIARPLCVETDITERIIDGRSRTMTAYEFSLQIGPGVLGPNSRLNAFKSLNTLAIVGWFYRRLVELSEDRPVQLRMSALRALFQHLTNEWKKGLKRRAVLRREGIRVNA